jgi:hypothetical protein
MLRPAAVSAFDLSSRSSYSAAGLRRLSAVPCDSDGSNASHLRSLLSITRSNMRSRGAGADYRARTNRTAHTCFGFSAWLQCALGANHPARVPRAAVFRGQIILTVSHRFALLHRPRSAGSERALRGLKLEASGWPKSEPCLAIHRALALARKRPFIQHSIFRANWPKTVGPLPAISVKVFGCRQASENRPCTNPRGCGDGLWGFRVLRGWGGCAAGSVRRLAAARCVRFVARRMTDWESAAAERQQLSADPNARRTLGHSLQRDGVAA